MQDLANAIHNLAVHDWVDYLAIFAPLILSVVAVWISILTAKKQNCIALLSKRLAIINDFEEYANSVLSSWDFTKLNIPNPCAKYSETELSVLLGKEFSSYAANLQNTIGQLFSLWGDYEHAINHGEYHGLTCEKIEENIAALCKDEAVKFKQEKDRLIKKYYKI